MGATDRSNSPAIIRIVIPIVTKPEMETAVIIPDMVRQEAKLGTKIKNIMNTKTNVSRGPAIGEFAKYRRIAL
jgi:hypothetical protein